MQESTSRQKILKNIRLAMLRESPGWQPGNAPSHKGYQASYDDASVVFAGEFQKAGGIFVYCDSMEDMKNGLVTLIRSKSPGKGFIKQTDATFLELEDFPAAEEDPDAAAYSITRCYALISETGSILYASSSPKNHRLISRPHLHIVVGFTSQIMTTTEKALQMMKTQNKGRLPAFTTLITGPSRTADIEKTLIYGAHGPKELYLFLIDDISTV